MLYGRPQEMPLVGDEGLESTCVSPPLNNRVLRITGIPAGPTRDVDLVLQLHRSRETSREIYRHRRLLPTDRLEQDEGLQSILSSLRLPSQGN